MTAKQWILVFSVFVCVGVVVWLADGSSIPGEGAKYVPWITAGIASSALVLNFLFNPIRLERYKRQVDAVMKLKIEVDKHASNFTKAMESRLLGMEKFQQSHLGTLAVYQELSFLIPSDIHDAFFEMMETFLHATSQLTDKSPEVMYRRFGNTCRGLVGTGRVVE